MIMPSKHINFSESILGFGSYLLNNLNQPKSIDELWEKYRIDLKEELYPAKHSFDNLILALIFLYSIDAIVEKNGVITKCA